MSCFSAKERSLTFFLNLSTMVWIRFLSAIYFLSRRIPAYHWTLGSLLFSWKLDSSFSKEKYYYSYHYETTVVPFDSFGSKLAFCFSCHFWIVKSDRVRKELLSLLMGACTFMACETEFELDLLASIFCATLACAGAAIIFRLRVLAPGPWVDRRSYFSFDKSWSAFQIWVLIWPTLYLLTTHYYAAK